MSLYFVVVVTLVVVKGLVEILEVFVADSKMQKRIALSVIFLIR